MEKSVKCQLKENKEREEDLCEKWTTFLPEKFGRATLMHSRTHMKVSAKSIHQNVLVKSGVAATCDRLEMDEKLLLNFAHVQKKALDSSSRDQGHTCMDKALPRATLCTKAVTQTVTFWTPCAETGFTRIRHKSQE